MSENEFGDIPEDIQNQINKFSDFSKTMDTKLVELWGLYKRLHDPNCNVKYKPIDKYVINDSSQAEGEFDMFIAQISGLLDKIPEIEKEITKSITTMKELRNRDEGTEELRNHDEGTTRIPIVDIEK